jgi:hypothetical protein
MNILRNMLTLGAITLLFSTLSLAQDASLQVTPDSKTGTYRLAYEGSQVGPLTVSIEDDFGNQLHRERLSNRQELNRAYRLTEMSSGTYYVVVKGPDGTLRQAIAYPMVANASQDMTLDVITDKTDHRFQLMLSSAPEKAITVRIYDGSMNLLYSERTTAGQQADQVFNLKRVGSDAAFFSVSDEYQTVTQRVSLR